MILIWRGWGLLAGASIIPLLASCAGLIDVEPPWIFMLAFTGSLLFAGIICVYWGTLWNREQNEHTFYFIPLQGWGWMHLTLIALYAALGLVSSTISLIWPPPNPPRIDPEYQLIGSVLVLLIIAVIAKSLLRLAQPQPEYEEVMEDDIPSY